MIKAQRHKCRDTADINCISKNIIATYFRRLLLGLYLLYLLGLYFCQKSGQGYPVKSRNYVLQTVTSMLVTDIGDPWIVTNIFKLSPS